MMHAAKLDGESPSDLDNSAFRHQILAVKNLGFDVFNADGSPFDANKAPMNPSFDQPTYDAAPTIADYVTSNNLEDVVICYAARLSPQASHTFAADGQSFFDNNTGGKLVGVSAIHSKVSDMKVIQVLRVRRRA